jgi:hypothetical protein
MTWVSRGSWRGSSWRAERPVPRPGTRTEEVGRFTLFVPTAGGTFYAPPAPRARARRPRPPYVRSPVGISGIAVWSTGGGSSVTPDTSGAVRNTASTRWP